MNILFVVPYVPNLVRVRPYHLIRGLHSHGHKITLVCLGTSGDQEALVALQPFLHNHYVYSLPAWRALLNCAAAIPSNRPLQSDYCWNGRMARLVADLAGQTQGTSNFDIVHVEHMRGLRYAMEVKKIPSPPPIVWDSVDSITHLFRQAVRHHPRFISRFLLRMELNRTQKMEQRASLLFGRVLVTSNLDRQVFMELQPTVPISVVPNGVDLDYFCPEPNLNREEDTLVISGKMSYHANVSMVLHLIEDIMPIVWSKMPKVKLWVVGQNPAAEILKYANDPRITITGSVPDLRPYLQRATLAVAPLRYGAGIQNKVLEAMACSTPVVASPMAVSALRIRAGEEILVAGDPEGYAQNILSLMSNSPWRTRMGVAGREFVQRQHSWETVVHQLENIYRSLIHKTG